MISRGRRQSPAWRTSGESVLTRPAEQPGFTKFSWECVTLQFIHHTRHEHAWECERFVKVFNSFVENRVEMDP